MPSSSPYSLSLARRQLSAAHSDTSRKRSGLFTHTPSHTHNITTETGLFHVAAIASHSCDPSCGWSTRVGGELRFFANRPIAAGEEITISTIPQLWSTPREERRRALLLRGKGFCRCARCALPDNLRGLPCVRDGCEGIAECCEEVGRAADEGTAGREGEAGEGIWRCCKCQSELTHAQMRPSLDAEANLVERVATLRRTKSEHPSTTTAATSPTAATPAAPNSSTSEGPTSDGSAPSGVAASGLGAADVHVAVASVRASLSPTHYLGPQLLSLLTASHETPLDPPPTKVATAATAAHTLALLECAAARCHSNACARAGVTQHGARPELVTEAVTAVLACAAASSKEWTARGAVISSRYLPWAVRQFGADDLSVQTMQSLLQLVLPQKEKQPAAATKHDVKRTQKKV